jgi:hypothetical protein
MAEDTDLSGTSEDEQPLTSVEKARQTRLKNRAQEMAEGETLAAETGEYSHTPPASSVLILAPAGGRKAKKDALKNKGL